MQQPFLDSVRNGTASMTRKAIGGALHSLSVLFGSGGAPHFRSVILGLGRATSSKPLWRCSIGVAPFFLARLTPWLATIFSATINTKQIDRFRDTTVSTSLYAH